MSEPILEWTVRYTLTYPRAVLNALQELLDVVHDANAHTRGGGVAELLRLQYNIIAAQAATSWDLVEEYTTRWGAELRSQEGLLKGATHDTH